MSLVAIQGATNIAKDLRKHLALARAGRLAGLCDAAEAPIFRSAIEDVGLGDDLEAAGFFVCRLDLEDELIRALGAERVVALIEEHGEGVGFAKFQQQPHQRTRPLEAQLHRFAGIKAGRKVRYGGMLAGALTEEATPEPLRRLIGRIRGWVD